MVITLAGEAIEVAQSAANRWTGNSFIHSLYFPILSPSFFPSGNRLYFREFSINILFCLLIIMCFNSADNIFTLRQWCSNNFPQAKEELENLYKEVHQLTSFSLHICTKVYIAISFRAIKFNSQNSFSMPLLIHPLPEFCPHISNRF